MASGLRVKSGKIKGLYDSALHKLLGELGLSLLGASNKGE
jgi:hypothetical protein